MTGNRGVILDSSGNPFRPSMKYNAAGFGRETHNLPAVCYRPDEEVRSNDLVVLRARCRHIAQNFPQASGYVQQMVRRVATQFRIQSRLADYEGNPLEEDNTRLESILKRAWRANPLEPWTGFTVDGLSFDRAMSLAMRTRIVDGEVFLVKALNRDNRRVIAREWQILDADNLADSAYGGKYTDVPEGHRVIQGVEINKKGRPVAYHFFDDVKTRNSWSRSTKRISADRVIHWFRPERPGQVRGVSELAKIILAFADVEEFSKAKIQAEWIANAFAALLTTDNMSGIEATFGTDSETGSDGAVTTLGDIQAGTMQALPVGTQVAFANPNRPGGNMEEFVRVYHRSIACACGISYEEYTRDFTNTNYSSARAAQQDSSFTYGEWTQDFDDNLVAPIYADAVNFVVYIHSLMPKPQAQELYAHEVQHKQPRGIDMLKEVLADAQAVENFQDTLTNVCARRGLDFREVAHQIAKERELLKELGIETATVMAAAAEQPQRTDDEPERDEAGARVLDLAWRIATQPETEEKAQ